MKKYIFTLFTLLFLNSVFSQVGIKTTNPQGVFNVDGAGDNTIIPTATQLKNDVVVLSNGNTGIGVLPTTTGAKLEVSPTTTSNSVLKLADISDTKNKQVTSINYGKTSKLLIDDTGNVVKAYSTIQDFSLAGLQSFDASILGLGTSASVFSPVSNLGTIFSFENGGSYLVYGEVTWGLKAGYRVVTHSFTASDAATADTLTLTGQGTNTLTFDFGSGSDLIFEITGTLDLRYMNVKKSAGTADIYILTVKNSDNYEKFYSFFEFLICNSNKCSSWSEHNQSENIICCRWYER